MKVSEFLEVVLRLFNDLIGAVVPGFLLMTGLVFLHTESFVDAVTARLPSSDWAVVLVVATSYASGHLLLAMASIFADGFKKLEEEKLFEGIVNYVRKLVKLEASSSEMAAEQHVRKLVEAQIRSSYEKNGGEGNSFSPLTFNELRNIAMTLRPEASALGYRFMSISLFCTGLGTAFCVVSLDAVVGRAIA
jgi:succinate dehydrogenase hydrophobic anchor subunit